MGILNFTPVLEALICSQKGASPDLYPSLVATTYNDRSTARCHIFDVLIMLFRLTSYRAQRSGSEPGVMTCDEIFRELFIKAVRSTSTSSLETYRAVFIADKQRHKRNNLHLKRDEAARRTADRIRQAERSGTTVSQAYPPTAEFSDRGVRTSPSSDWEHVDIKRILVSQGRPAADAFWQYMQNRLQVAAESDSRESMLEKLYGRSGENPGSWNTVYCSIEADLVEHDEDTFGEADIGIIQRAIGELRKPEHPTKIRRTVVVIHSDDSDAIVHSMYAAWSLGLTRSSLFVHRSLNYTTAATKRNFIYDIRGIVALLSSRGWTRDHFLAAAIIGGCDFFKLADGVTIRNIGPVPLWNAQSRCVGRLRAAVFPTPAAVTAMYIHVIASHCGVDILDDLPMSGDATPELIDSYMSERVIETMFTMGAPTRARQQRRSLRPMPPKKDMQEVCERFAQVWRYWTTSFDITTIPPHPSVDRRVEFYDDVATAYL